MPNFGGFGWYIMLVIGPVLLGLWAQYRVKSAFGRASQLGASSGMSGAEVAQEICRAYGVTGVKVEPVQGFLTDHYDPSAKVLRLSPEVYSGRSVAALGIAAHEVGHAIQHAKGYMPLKLRSAVVPAAKFGGAAANIALFAGFILMSLFARSAIGSTFGIPLLLIGIGGLLLVALFQLITLPVEFDASRRAKDILNSTGIISQGQESKEMSAVLNAAALTYVAALVATLGTILYYVLIIMSRGGDRR